MNTRKSALIAILLTTFALGSCDLLESTNVVPVSKYNGLMDEYNNLMKERNYLYKNRHKKIGLAYAYTNDGDAVLLDVPQ